jgi:hypothetical protein
MYYLEVGKARKERRPVQRAKDREDISACNACNKQYMGVYGAVLIEH